MDEKEYNVKPGILGTEGRTYNGCGVVRAPEGNRELVKYAYRVVHSQESIRLLDLRIATDAGVDFRHLQQLFGALQGGLTVDVAFDLIREDEFDDERTA